MHTLFDGERQPDAPYPCLPDHCREDLARSGCQRRAEARQFIYHKGAEPESCYLLLSGKVKLFLLSAGGDERITDVIEPGEYFGEVEFFCRQPYLTFAQAMKPSRYLSISRETLGRMLEQEPRLARQMLELIAMRSISLERDLHALCFHSSRRRLLNYLLSEAGGQRRTAGECEIRLGMRKGEIAARLGVTPETLSRILRELADEELIAVCGNCVTLRASFFAAATDFTEAGHTSPRRAMQAA